MKKLKFSKYHGLGNDFIVIDQIDRRKNIGDIETLARAMCDRNTGIGGDGLLLLNKSKSHSFRFDIYNADGSWAEKSGNGLRIAAAYYHANYIKKKNFAIETRVDTAKASIISSGKSEYKIRVALGHPQFETTEVPMISRQKFHINQPLKIEGHEFILTSVSVGNPHAVIFTDNFDFDWRFLGSVIENSKPFPNRTNVEFAKIVNRKKIILNDWERGAGDTGSSGTGAGAAVAAGIINGYLDRKVIVKFPLGDLLIEWPDINDEIYLTGLAKHVADGEYIFS